MIVVHAAVAIAVVIVLILVTRVDPVIALVIGSLYLGIAAGLGFEKTITTIAEGFGDIMADVGLLIGFGVLLGSLLHAVGALQKLVEMLLRVLGPRKFPYTLAVALSTVFPSIYVDVQLVLAAPLARSAALRIGRNGLGMMGGALTTGILVGYVFVVPGLGTVAIAGLLHVPLGTMLPYGFVLGPLTAFLTLVIFSFLLRCGFWNPAKDELAGTLENDGSEDDANVDDPRGATGSIVGTLTERRAKPRLSVSLLPIVVPLLLIATGAITEAAGVHLDVIALLGNPVFALFVGMLGAYVMAHRTLGAERLAETMTKGFNSTGQILLVTGVGGSLGSVIGATNLDDVLSGLFSADAAVSAVVTVLLAWLVAALLHFAIGSISVAGIAAAGVLAPIMGSLGIPAPVLALAIGSGSLLALHVNSNFFWMFQSLLGVTTRGTLKALTFVTSLASLVSLVLIMGVSVVV